MWAEAPRCKEIFDPAKDRGLDLFVNAIPPALIPGEDAQTVNHRAADAKCGPLLLRGARPPRRRIESCAWSQRKLRVRRGCARLERERTSAATTTFPDWNAFMRRKSGHPSFDQTLELLRAHGFDAVPYAGVKGGELVSKDCVGAVLVPAAESKHGGRGSCPRRAPRSAGEGRGVAAARSRLPEIY
jgi:hypothetical protein